MIKKISEFFLCLFVVFVIFPIKFLAFDGSVYLSGEFSPFLSHFFYLSDLFLILSLLFCALYLIFNDADWLRRKIYEYDLNLLFLVSIFVLFLSISLFFSVYIENSFIYLIRFLEFFIFYLLIIFEFASWRRLLLVFILALFCNAMLGISQFVFQHSFGFKFLGEPYLTNILPGVAKIDFFSFKLLRIYGSFSHPNVFAAFLFVGILLTSSVLKLKIFTSDKLRKVFFFTFCIALFFTFSKSIFIALFVVFLILYRPKFHKKAMILLFTLFLILLFLFYLSPTTIFERMRLINVSFNLFLHRPFGVGLGNFTAAISQFSYFKLFPWNYQPVHNVFLLILNEIGLGGFIVIVLLFCYMFYESWKKKDFLLVSLVLGLIWMAFFDHYLFTLYQGQFLFFFLLIFFTKKNYFIRDL